MNNYKLIGEVTVAADDIGDGVYTMNQLYEHRIVLFCALTKIYDNYITPFNTRVKCWKSKLYWDGISTYDCFIVGMTIHQFDGTEKQIIYNIPNDWWEKFKLMELPHAPKYDGHTSKDVLVRLMEL